MEAATLQQWFVKNLSNKTAASLPNKKIIHALKRTLFAAIGGVSCLKKFTNHCDNTFITQK
jgi:hypothetical protein